MIPDMQQRFDGFLDTAPLWTGKFHELEQFDFPDYSNAAADSHSFSSNLRLGQLAEQFVFAVLTASPAVKIIAQNLQIIREKITIGELDALVHQHNLPLHLEIVYKFYLYDPTVGNTELDHWIGPNRKDSLIQKLTKLKEKQLPLLHTQDTKKALDELGLDPSRMKQEVLFKAQLFVPFNYHDVEYTHLNKDAVTGFYCTEKQLRPFHDCTFFIPTKLDWLAQPSTEIDWLTFDAFHDLLMPQLLQKRAPLCWMKKPTGEIEKLFVVWWI